MIILTNDEGYVGMAAAVAALQQGESALDVVEAGIRPVEADPRVRSVGVGGAPNLLGQAEFDASIMDGATLRSGAVGAIQGYLHPISVARQVMERLPHVMLVGQGATRFAREIGAEAGQTLTHEALADYQIWVDHYLPPQVRAHLTEAALARYAWPDQSTPVHHGTTTWLVIDGQGNLAGGVSTSGWAYKYPGRLGDSPIIGAGLYVNNRFGGCACTHTGEMAIRAATAHAVVLYMKMGATVEAACHEAAEDLAHLQGGYLDNVTIHAIDRHGHPYVLSTLREGDRPRYYTWLPGWTEPALGHGDRHAL